MRIVRYFIAIPVLVGLVAGVVILLSPAVGSGGYAEYQNQMIDGRIVIVLMIPGVIILSMMLLEARRSSNLQDDLWDENSPEIESEPETESLFIPDPYPPAQPSRARGFEIRERVERELREFHESKERERRKRQSDYDRLVKGFMHISDPVKRDSLLRAARNKYLKEIAGI